MGEGFLPTVKLGEIVKTQIPQIPWVKADYIIFNSGYFNGCLKIICSDGTETGFLERKKRCVEIYQIQRLDEYSASCVRIQRDLFYSDWVSIAYEYYEGEEIGLGPRLYYPLRMRSPSLEEYRIQEMMVWAQTDPLHCMVEWRYGTIWRVHLYPRSGECQYFATQLSFPRKKLPNNIDSDYALVLESPPDWIKTLSSRDRQINTDFREKLSEEIVLDSMRVVVNRFDMPVIIDSSSTITNVIQRSRIHEIVKSNYP
jgi:hypothetical protein